MVRETGRWIVMHQPSKQWVGGMKDKKEALAVLQAASRGEDPHEFLPKVLKVKREFGEEKKRGKKDKSASADRARAHEEKADSRGPGAEEREQKDEKKDAVRPENWHAEFQEVMETRFSPARLATVIDDMLSAQKPVMVGEEVVHEPDWVARERGVRLAIEHTRGKATEAPEVKKAKKMTYDELRANCLKSPAMRRMLRTMVEEAEAEARLETQKA